MSDEARSKIRVGMIGCGGHVTKNILPCFGADADREIAAIYVRDPAEYARKLPDLAEAFTSDLAAILADATIDVIYIATPISTHHDYAVAALNAGKHVWCEKPMTTSLAETQGLVMLARERGLFLGEVAVYRHHRQYAWVVETIAAKRAAGEALIGACARFSIPALDPGNIRYAPELGGGALLDVGYYPLSVMTGLFGLPSEMLAVGAMSDAYGVDLSGTALLSYGDFGAQCVWAIGSSYANELELSFTKSTLLVERAFSKPATLETEIQVAGPFGQPEAPVMIAADDQFDNLFNDLAASIRTGDRAEWARMAEQAIEAATVIERARSMIVPRV